MIFVGTFLTFVFFFTIIVDATAAGQRNSLLLLRKNSDPPSGASQGFKLFIAGSGQTADDWSIPREAARLRGYSTGVFIQNSESPDFHAGFRTLVRELRASIEDIHQRYQPNDLEIIAHSAGTITTFRLYLVWKDMHEFVSSIIFSSPVFKEQQFLTDEQIKQLEADDRQAAYELKRKVKRGDRILEYGFLRSGFFAQANYTMLKRNAVADFLGSSGIKIRILYSPDDPNTDEGAIFKYADKLYQLDRNPEIISVRQSGDSHNLWQGRKPDDPFFNLLSRKQERNQIPDCYVHFAALVSARAKIEALRNPHHRYR